MLITEYNNDIFKNIPGVYKINCLANNKVYIGSSKNICKRLRTHLNYLYKNKHDSPYLQHAFNRYGESSFTIEVVKVVNNLKLLFKEEQVYVNSYNSIAPNGFNCNSVCGAPPIITTPICIKNFLTNEVFNFDSLMDCAEKLNLNYTQVSSLRNKRIKTTGDFCLPEYTPKIYYIFNGNIKMSFFRPREFARLHNIHQDILMTLIRGKRERYKTWLSAFNITSSNFYIGKDLPITSYKYKFFDIQEQQYCFANNCSELAKQLNVTKDILYLIYRNKCKKEKRFKKVS